MTLPTLLELTPEQEAVVILPFDGRYLVTGPAGSGKSVTAAYRAWALATAGRRTVLVTRSNLLTRRTAHIAQRIADGVRVITFHRWLRDFWNDNFACDPPCDGDDEWDYDWDAMLGECLNSPPARRDALVVDEGQQLPQGFYRLSRLVTDRITVFADEYMGIDGAGTALETIGSTLKAVDGMHTLTTNLRSTREVAELADTFCVGPATIPQSPPRRTGEQPVLLHCSRADGFLNQLSQFIAAHRDYSVGIVCRSTRLVRDIHRQLAERGHDDCVDSYISGDIHRSAVDFSSHRVHVIHAASMKGMEFDALFVPDLDAYAEDPTGAIARRRFYVLCTRARQVLYLVHHGRRVPDIVADVPGHLLERRSV
ncbi:AAA family ATPase [Streptomyces longispororuber]|uniref:AAA family ATPase n=1 Tax=Streptomyces longispororuber TaxID=68230 RepID=UPI0036F7E8E5